MTEDVEDLWIPYVKGKTLELMDGIVVGLVEVTPDVARNWLACNSRNRPLSDPTWDRYKRDMIGSRWSFTGDTVRFSDDLKMLDGQHRCTAVIESGTTQLMLVVSGLPTSTQARMDGGRRRNAGTTLSIDETKNSTTVAALARLALLWNPGGVWVKDRGTELFGSMQISPAEVLEFVEQHPEAHEAARVGAAVAWQVPGARPSVIGAAFLRASLLDDVFDAAEWFSQLETGAGLALGNPLLALRNGMMRASAEKLSNPQIPQLWKVIRAWNASRVNEPMRNMVVPKNRMTNENFPDMH